MTRDENRTAVGAFVDHEGWVLLLRRADDDDNLPGIYELPSGIVEPGETLTRALMRELHEEAGLRVSSLGAFVNEFSYRTRTGVLTRQFNFHVPSISMDVTLSREHDSYRWVDRSTFHDPAFDHTLQALLGEFYDQLV